MNALFRAPYRTLRAGEIAAAVRAGDMSAREIVTGALDEIEARNGAVNAFTSVTAERALARADALDAARARGEAMGPLAGVPFAVKNLFDIAGAPTLAGSRINADDPPAREDAFAIRRLEAAGAVLVGALNMGEYAYDFTGENAHYGPARNPHDLTRMSGGSSGGSGAAVAAGMAPLTLGSDTNGSVRVPSAFCGVFGLKPTFGRLSRAGTFPFVASLDHVGLFARGVGDLALAYDAAQGGDADDPAQAVRPVEPALPELSRGSDGLRMAVADGYFRRSGEADAFAAVDRAAAAINASARVELPQAHVARAAAYLITMAEGGALHLDRLRERAADYDPDTRERLMAGALLPAQWLMKAQKFRRAYRDAVLALLRDVDVILAPATPCAAPLLGQKKFTLDGVELNVRANVGVFTQPISFIGLPVVVAPIWLPGAKMPLGVQIIAAPWREDAALRVAAALETLGAASAPVAN